jgi:hypothetical protein
MTAGSTDIPETGLDRADRHEHTQHRGLGHKYPIMSAVHIRVAPLSSWFACSGLAVCSEPLNSVCRIAEPDSMHLKHAVYLKATV